MPRLGWPTSKNGLSFVIDGTGKGEMSPDLPVPLPSIKRECAHAPHLPHDFRQILPEVVREVGCHPGDGEAAPRGGERLLADVSAEASDREERLCSRERFRGSVRG